MGAHMEVQGVRHTYLAAIRLLQTLRRRPQMDESLGWSHNLGFSVTEYSENYFRFLLYGQCMRRGLDFQLFV